MLWYKAWLETRWRFLIGLVLLSLSAAGTVLTYPQVVKLIAHLPQQDFGGPLGRRIAEALDLSRSYRGYVWGQAFRQNLLQMWTLFAVLLGTGGLLHQASGGGALFTLSLPVTRARLAGVRAATGLLELSALAFVPALLLPMLSPGIGQSYALTDALAHGACLFLGGAFFFSLTFLLSTVFGDLWRPPLLVLCLVFAFAMGEWVLGPRSPLGIMTGESYFRGQGLPWLGLFVSTVASVLLLSGASKNLARQDF
jgi:ABC-2 type transport system permease protein